MPTAPIIRAACPTHLPAIETRLLARSFRRHRLRLQRALHLAVEPAADARLPAQQRVHDHAEHRRGAIGFFFLVGVFLGVFVIGLFDGSSLFGAAQVVGGRVAAGADDRHAGERQGAQCLPAQQAHAQGGADLLAPQLLDQRLQAGGTVLQRTRCGGDLIGQRLPGTLALMGAALGIAIFVGVFLGSIMALFSGKLPDRIISIGSLIFYSVPGFWIGLMLILTFSVKLGWLPSGGDSTIGSSLTGFSALLDRLRYIVLPALSLALYFLAIYARLTRAAMLEVKSQDYVRTARAKGVSPIRLTTRHILRNALIPITTMAGMHIGGLLGGAVVVETVFSWPGLGRLAFEAVMARDFSVLLGILLLSSLVVIIVNAAVDLLQAWLDPRIGESR